MTQQLDFDFTQEPRRNPEYFYPLNLRLDPVEKENFIKTGLVQHVEKLKDTGYGLSNVGNADQYFKNTKKQIDKLVKPLGLKTRKFTLFVSDKSVTSWVIHSDGVVNDITKKPAILEARLSFYEMAEAPGAIRWWDNLPTTLQEHPATEYAQARINCMADCAENLRDDKITWADIPNPAFSVVTSTPSAILRTNRPHHVIQGPGMRVTVSFQLVFENGQPEGVWEHIEKNIHIIEKDPTNV